MERLALIAGRGEFPLEFARAARTNGVNLVALAFREETEEELASCVDKIYWLEVGELGRLFDILKKEKIKKAVMAGAVTKTRLFDAATRADERLEKLLGEVKDKKDASLLGAVAKRLKEAGVELLDSAIYLDNLFVKEGILTRTRPTPAQGEDIRFGFALAKKIAELDIGQTVVVKDKVILAIEAIEGTDAAIRRAGQLGREGAVVVKVSRPRQDKRFDIPTVGKDTIKSLIAAKARVLAIEAGNTLVLNRRELVRLADQHRIAVVAVK